MEGITKDTLHDFYWYTSLKNPEWILEHHRWRAERVHHYREKIKNPVHYLTGKPLKAITIKAYLQILHSCEQSLRDSKTVIKMLVGHGILGSKGPKGKTDKVVAFHPYRKKRQDEIAEKKLFDSIFKELFGE